MATKNITYTVSYRQETDVPVRGNVMASGDDAADREAEQEILDRLYRDDDAAWCRVKVTATIGGAFTGTAYLGCVTLTDDYTAEQCAKDHGMKDEALDDLIRKLKRAVQTGEDAKLYLSELSA